MRNAKIISYKVKGSFQHNFSVFARRQRQDFILTGPHGGAMILRVAGAKTKPIFHFLAIILFACEPRVRGEYLKMMKNFFCRRRFLDSSFYLFVKDYFVSSARFFGWLVIIEQVHTKNAPNDSIQIWNLQAAFCVRGGFFGVLLSAAFWCLSAKKNAQP